MDQRSSSTSDRGFTLIELLVTTLIIAMASGAVAMAATVIFRARPSTEARIDDARTLLGLTTRLPEDVNSTPPAGLWLPSSHAQAADPANSTGCTQDTSAGLSLAKLTWTERTDTYTANYRFIPDGGGGRIVRYTCKNHGAESVSNMTSELPPIPASWVPGTAPIAFVRVGSGADLDVAVTTVANDVLTLEARSNNPAEALPPTPPPAYPPIPYGNQPPVAGDHTVFAVAGGPVVVTLPASDYDAGDQLTLTGSQTGGPPGWTFGTAANSVTVTLTPPTSPAPNAGEVLTFAYVVTDPFGQTDGGTLTVTLTAAPVNNPPTAGDINAATAANAPLQINLAGPPTVYVSDGDGDAFTVSVPASPPAGTSAVSVNASNVLTIAPSGSQSTIDFTYTVTDEHGATATANVHVDVTLCQVTSVTAAGMTTPGLIQRVLKSGPGSKIANSGPNSGPVAYTVAFTGPCTSLGLAVDYDNDGIANWISGNGAVTSPATVTILDHNSGPAGWQIKEYPVTIHNGAGTAALNPSALTLKILS